MKKAQSTTPQGNATTALQLRKLPNLQPDAAMATAEQLRNQATTYHDQFVVKGRKAALALMADLYALYHGAKVSSDNGAMFISKVKAKLVELDVEVRKSSPESSQLVRFVFKDAADKQVSIYGRSLAVAFARGIKPSEYVSFIEATPDGFSGVRATTAPKTQGTGAAKLGADIALVHVRAETTVKTIVVTDWEDDEEFRVLIAVRNDDDTADVKNARLSKDSTKAVVLRYEADKKARNKPTPDQSVEADKLALKTLSAEASNAQTKLENIEAELSSALESGDTKRCDLLRVHLRVASLQAKAAESVHRQLQAALKEEVAA